MTPALFLSLALSTPAAPADPPPNPRPAVAKGLGWLAGKQRPDGSWVGSAVAMPTMITAYSGLALLMEGSTPAEGRYAGHIRRAIGWFEKVARADGRLVGPEPNEQFNEVPAHAAAMLFLSCAHDADTDDARRARVKKLLENAVAFLAAARTPRGGWGNLVSRANGGFDDTQSTAAALQALLAARKAGIDVPQKMIDGAVGYFVKCTGPDGAVVSSAVPGPPMRGAGLPLYSANAAAAVGLDGPRPGAFAGWVRDAERQTDTLNIPTGGAYVLLAHYPIARLAFGLGDSGHRKFDPHARDERLLKWSAYRGRLFKAVTAAQQKDGSWPDQIFGPEYATAVALVLLQLENDYLPALSR